MHAVLYIPSFRLQAALRLQEDAVRSEPAGLTDDAEKKNVILEINAAARHSGVQIGASVPRALARCGNLKIILRSLAGESSAHTALMQTAYALSPEMEATAPGLCTLQLRLAPGTDMAAEGQRAVALLEQAGLKALAGIAPNPDLALLAARRARPVLVVHEPSAFLDALPVAALGPPPHLVELLHDWGINTLRQLRTLPRADLADRLGREAGLLWERASGLTSRPLNVTEPPREFAESCDFEHEVETLEPLLFLLRRFLHLLTLRLQCMGLVAGSMILTLRLERSEIYERHFTIPSPCADTEVLFRISFTHLESLRLENRPAGMTLRLEPVRPSHDQFQLFETVLRDPNRLGETLARLSALTGRENTGVCVREDSHQPDAWRLDMPQFHRLAPAAKSASILTGLPLRRLRPAPPAEVETAEHVPVHLTSSSGSGRVAAALGPHRSSGRWWEQTEWSREEWDVELEDGSLLRLAKLPAGWVVEGFYEVLALPRAPVLRLFPSAPDAFKQGPAP